MEIVEPYIPKNELTSVGKTRKARIDTLIAVLKKLYHQKDLPTSVRTVYYRLISDHSLYRQPCWKGFEKKKLVDEIDMLLSYARKKHIIPFSWFSDDNKPYYSNRGRHTDPEEAAYNPIQVPHLEWCARSVQDIRIEVWCEKRAHAENIKINRLCQKYCIPIVGAGGQPSLSQLNMLAERDPHIVLWIGDLDPDGVRIPASALRTLELMGSDIEIQRVALLPDHVSIYNLDPMPQKMRKDQVFDYFYDLTFLDEGYEIDALEIDNIVSLLEETIERHYNMSRYEEQQEAQERINNRFKRISKSPVFKKDQAKWEHRFNRVISYEISKLSF